MARSSWCRRCCSTGPWPPDPGGTAGVALAAAVLLAALLGGATELRQAWVPGREADPFDLLADVAGSVLYAVVDGDQPADEAAVTGCTVGS
jgi:hypothetical protein